MSKVKPRLVNVTHSRNCGKTNYMSHVLYTHDDFTAEEIDRRNKLAEMVVDGGLDVCKMCGEYEAGLSEEYCKNGPKLEEN